MSTAVHDETNAPLRPARPARKTQAERSRSTRDRLITAAVEALYGLGYAATSTTLVAEMAGVSRGAMVHQFPTKVALMLAVARSTYDADRLFYRKALAQPMSAQQRLLVLFDAAWTQFSAPGGIAQTEIWMATRSDPELAAVVIPLHDEITELTRAFHANLFKEAGIDDGQVSTAVFTMHIAALRGLALERTLGTGDEAIASALAMMRARLEALLEPATTA
jgi:AcrR family transcriptional regulator